MFTDEDLELIHAEAARVEGQRRLGVLLMYSPAFFFVLMVGLILTGTGWQTLGQPHHRSPGTHQPPPPWMVVVLLPILVGLVLSIPTAVVGVALRAMGAAKLARFVRQWEVESLPARPPVRIGEQLGLWRVERTPGTGGLQMVKRCAPGPAWALMRWGIYGVVIWMIGAGVYAGLQGGPPLAGIMAGLFMCLWCMPLAAYFVEERVRVDITDRRRVVSQVRKWHTLLPRGVRRLGLEELGGLSAGPGALYIHALRGRGIAMTGFSPGALGKWQIERVIGAAAEELSRG